MTDPVTLDARALTVWRGDLLLLDAVDLTVRPGEVWQIHGPNGSGKTSFLRILAGLGEADDGELLWRGQPMRRVRDQLYDDLLYFGHKPGISGALTPRENLDLMCGLRGQGASQIEEALLELNLANRQHLRCASLSAGQQRRVSLARLLLQRASLWVLDEPLTALDAAGLAWVQSRLAEQVARGGSVVLTTHQPLQNPAFDTHTLELHGGVML